MINRKPADEETVLKWEEVEKRHGSQAGVQLEGGRVVSVLCGGQEHADHVLENTVTYSIPARPYYLKCISALQTSFDEGTDFSVFYKLRPNMWRDLGRFTVSKIEHKEKVVLCSFIQSL